MNLVSVAVPQPAKVAGRILRTASRAPWLAAAGLGVAACLTADLVGTRRTAPQGRSPNRQSAPGSSRRDSRVRSVFRHTRATTVVNHPVRFSTLLVSARLRRSQASWTASSASLREPSIR